MENINKENEVKNNEINSEKKEEKIEENNNKELINDNIKIDDEINLNINIEKLLNDNKDQNLNEINNNNNINNQNEISTSNINDKALIDITQNENKNTIEQNSIEKNKGNEKEDIDKDFLDINIKNDIEVEEEISNIILNQSKLNENEKENENKEIKDDNNNDEKINDKNINMNEDINKENNDKDEIINLLKKQNNDLEKEISDLKNELKIQSNELTEANNEVIEYKNQYNEEKNMNFVLQKKIKDLNTKIQLKTIEEMTKNGKININNNINNININANINSYKKKDKEKDNDKDNKANENNKNENENENENENNEKNDNEAITPDKYIIIKSCQLNHEFKWYLLKNKFKNLNNENLSPLLMSLKKHRKRDNKEDQANSLDNSNDNNISYSDFVWVPAKNKKELEEFGELPMSESFEREKIIRQLESNIKILENKCKKREREYNLLNMNYSKLVYRNKNEKVDKLIETIERLRNENKNLNIRLASYSSRRHFIGLSFIEQDENDSSFIEDKCLEDILDELNNNEENDNYNENYNYIYNKNNNNNNNYYYYQRQHRNSEYNRGGVRYVGDFKDKMYYNTANKFYPMDMRKSSYKKIVNSNENRHKEGVSIQNLKSSIDTLMTQIEPSQSARSMFANILRQLGCSDEDIYKLIGNYRGVISIPYANLKNRK